MPFLKIADNSTVVIHDEKSDQVIAKTKIINYDRTHNRITVDGNRFPLNDNQRVSMLILGDEGIIECMGLVRRLGIRGTREIAIYNTRLKEDRGAVRYNIIAPAVIEKIIINDKTVSLETPVNVVVENISTSGVQLTAPADALNLDTAFQLKLDIAGNIMLINTSVVRVVSEDKSGSRLGCSFISLSESPDISC